MVTRKRFLISLQEEEIQQMTQQVYQSEMVVRELQRGDLVEQGLVSPPVPICEGLKVGGVFPFT